MHPELISLGPVTLYSYGVLLAASYLLGLQLARRRAITRGLDPNRILDLGIYIIIAALIALTLSACGESADETYGRGYDEGFENGGSEVCEAVRAKSYGFYRRLEIDSVC